MAVHSETSEGEPGTSRQRRIVEMDPPATPRACEKRRRAEDQLESDTAEEARPPSPARACLEESAPASPARPTQSNAVRSSGSQATADMKGRRSSTRATNAAPASPRTSSSDGGTANDERLQAPTAARATHSQATRVDAPAASSSTRAPSPSIRATLSLTRSPSTSRHATMPSASAARGTGDDDNFGSDDAPLGRPSKGRKPAQRRAPTSDSDDEFESPANVQSPPVSANRAQRPRRTATPTQLRISPLEVDSESPDDGNDAAMPVSGAGGRTRAFLYPEKPIDSGNASETVDQPDYKVFSENDAQVVVLKWKEYFERDDNTRLPTVTITFKRHGDLR
ncbi:hypothetical protein EV714DRAFT_277776 [Schizophyllum commune]